MEKHQETFRRTMRLSELTHRRLRLKSAQTGIPLQMLADLYIQMGLRYSMEKTKDMKRKLIRNPQVSYPNPKLYNKGK